jgi:two-component system NarL family sensor kinase
VAVKLREAAAATRRCIRQLRSLLVEIYPATLHRAGLEAALTDMTARFGSRNVEANVAVDARLKLPSETEALLFRVAQEALRNVAAHSRATRVDVRVAQTNGHASVCVDDDGRGFTPEEAQRRSGEGHLGLGLLADLVHEAGGSLEIESSPGKGTRLRAEVPVP